jgi:hypothetical protein
MPEKPHRGGQEQRTDQRRVERNCHRNPESTALMRTTFGSGKTPKTAITIAAALVINPADFLSPSTTASVLSRIRRYVSRMRETIRTSDTRSHSNSGVSWASRSVHRFNLADRSSQDVLDYTRDAYGR